MKTLESELRSSIEGEVHFDPLTRNVYSVDASIFEIIPTGVVIPKNNSDLINICAISRHFQVPLTVRGAATGITGGCLGHGLIIDLSKYFNKILHVDYLNKFVICEPGVVQDDLNKHLAPSGYRLGPDTSTGNRATLGGMLANNAAGARSLRYGKMVDHVQSVELLLSTGNTITFSPISEAEWKEKCVLQNQEGDIYRTLWEIKCNEENEIRKYFPQIPRRVSGYNLDELLQPFPFNVSKIIAGSEGTLGIATAIRMGIVSKPKAMGLLLLFFNDLIEAMRVVPELLEFHPLSLEMIDHQIIELGRVNPLFKNSLNWLKGDPQAILILEMEGETTSEIEEKINEIKRQLEQRKLGDKLIPILQTFDMTNVWNLRKAGLGILLSKRTYSRAIAFLEDLSIPPLKLASFMERFCSYLTSHGKQAGIYGHVGSGCMHIRPYLDLRDPKEFILMQQMMNDISTLVLEYGGALSGEHGDGFIRSWLNPKMFGESLMHSFKKIKHAFDPLNLMNPGKIIPLKDEWQNLRTKPNEQLQSPQTFLNFKAEGGFELAVDLCNGNGLCRKKQKLMCPSFQATNEEFHSTRARAQALRAIIHKHLPVEDFTSKSLYEVMDLCISCKGCKTECPSQVDMAKFKSEFLYHYQQKHGYSLRNRLFAHIGQFNHWTSPFAALFNQINRWSITRKILEWIGISPRRSLPELSSQKFSTWFSLYKQPSSLGKKLILFNDTFTEFNHPEIGQEAVKLFNALGFYVVLSTWSCCGRPALSKGFLPLAQQQARELINRLWNHAQNGTPIVGLEPSCLLTIRDDYLSLIQPKEEIEHQQLKQVLAQCYTLDEYLALLIDQGEFTLRFKNERRSVKVHGHCYQKALVGMKPTLKVLESIPGFFTEEIPSGCCGMAGSFGYEKEHESISMQIGELCLFPAVRKSEPDDLIIASGMSCRHQIKDGTQRRAMHLVEALTSHLMLEKK